MNLYAQRSSNIRRVAALVVAVLILPQVSFAQVNRSYQYADINTVLMVNKDTTVAVNEKQTYAFIGEYHLGWRGIAHKGIDGVTNISVVDADTGKSLIYSAARLNKDDPGSWGKYTVYEQSGATNIEWYYDLSRTINPNSHTWTLLYTVHGALGFYADHDELYWNLFTGYTVPVASVEASVLLPGKVTKSLLSFYTSTPHTYLATLSNDHTFAFTTSGIAAGESVTFAAGWQKGLIDKGAYWSDAAKTYWPIEAGIAVLILAMLFCLLYWLWEERANRGRGVIIAEYEPPQNLPPAMAEVVSTGHVSAKTWAATVVDLAVRGLVTITEEKKRMLFFSTTNYTLTKADMDGSSLRAYERDFLDMLFPASAQTLSLAKLKSSFEDRQRINLGMQTLTKKLYAEVMQETGAFIHSPVRSWYWWKWFRIVLTPILFICIFVSGGLVSVTGSGLFLFFCLIIAAVVCIYFTQVRPELNRQGHLLKEDWMGFKLFLGITGKDRLQNLTPEMFEKFLPYAMIFGLEKKWAQRFDAFNLPPPQWYAGAGLVSSGGSPAGAFSPSAFASGFSSSFASSFASAGGGGGSGGGGGAGGGGGGGGGGAA